MPYRYRLEALRAADRLADKSPAFAGAPHKAPAAAFCRPVVLHQRLREPTTTTTTTTTNCMSLPLLEHETEDPKVLARVEEIWEQKETDEEKLKELIDYAGSTPLIEYNARLEQEAKEHDLPLLTPPVKAIRSLSESAVQVIRRPERAVRSCSVPVKPKLSTRTLCLSRQPGLADGPSPRPLRKWPAEDCSVGTWPECSMGKGSDCSSLGNWSDWQLSMHFALCFTGKPIFDMT
eukprot:g67181.t1